jgi:endogenous inhibitor of DNA gyrase (YacG/DUF329 family)
MKDCPEGNIAMESPGSGEPGINMDKIKCPRCGRESMFAGNPFRPFCSERCRLLDLDNWLSGNYGVPTVSDKEEVPTPESNEKTGDS